MRSRLGPESPHSGGPRLAAASECHKLVECMAPSRNILNSQTSWFWENQMNRISEYCNTVLRCIKYKCSRDNQLSTPRRTCMALQGQVATKKLTTASTTWVYAAGDLAAHREKRKKTADSTSNLQAEFLLAVHVIICNWVMWLDVERTRLNMNLAHQAHYLQWGLVCFPKLLLSRCFQATDSLKSISTLVTSLLYVEPSIWD